MPHELLLDIESSHGFEDEADDHGHGTEFTSSSYESAAPFQRQAFERFAAALRKAVVRTKGVLYLLDEPDHRFIYRMMGSRWKLTPGQPWGDEQPQPGTVRIGLTDRLESHNIVTALESCAPPGSDRERLGSAPHLEAGSRRAKEVATESSERPATEIKSAISYGGAAND